MDVRILSSDSEVADVVPEWLALHGRWSSGSPYNHPLWTMAWWRQRRHLGLRWHLCAGRDTSGTLVALMPLVVYSDGIVRFAGSDLHDEAATLAGDNERGVLWRLALAQLGRRGGATTVDLPTLNDADLAALESLDSEVDSEVYDIDPGARIELPSSWGDYWSALPAKRRKRMRAERRALERDHGLMRFQVVGDHDLVAAVREFWALREASWRARGRYGELAEHVRGQYMREFLAELAARGSGSGLVAIARLMVGDQTVASALLLRANGRAWYSMCTFAPAFARYGPGRLLLAECVRAAIADGFTVLELGRGVEPYKFALGATRYELANIRLNLGRRR